MPRTPQANREIKEARRKEIISAAFALLAEKGSKKLTFSELGVRMGISHGLIYHYFENREELLIALSKAKEDLRRVEWGRAQKVGSIDGLAIVSSFYDETPLREDDRNYALFELRRNARGEDDARYFGKDPLLILAGLLEQAAWEDLIPHGQYIEKARVISDYIAGYLSRLAVDETAAFSKAAFSRLVSY